MTFAQAQGMFRTYKTYETACAYLVVASQRKADEATTFFNAVGEVASWLSAPDEHLLAFEAAKTKTALVQVARSSRRAQTHRARRGPQITRIMECRRGQDSARAKRPALASRR
jgi:hypothetical protein